MTETEKRRRATDRVKAEQEAYDNLTRLFSEIVTANREHPGCNKNGEWIKYVQVNNDHYLS